MTLQEQYIYKHHQDKPMKKMAKELDISYHRVRTIMIANSWQSKHKRCTTIYQPSIPDKDLFNWDIFKQTDFIFQQDQSSFKSRANGNQN